MVTSNPDDPDPTARAQYLYDTRLEQLLNELDQLARELRVRGQVNDEEAIEYVAEARQSILAARGSMYFAWTVLRREE